MTARFYIEQLNPEQGLVELGRDEAHHLSRVLRLQPGDAVVVFDAKGIQYEARIQSIGKKSAVLALERQIAETRKIPREVIVAISLIRPDAMSLLVQKLTELGVARLAPFVAARTSLPGAAEEDSDEQRRKRWQRISLAACKQSGRPLPIAIDPVRPFKQVVKDFAGKGNVFLAWEGRDACPLAQAMREMPSKETTVTLLIGPEGGFTREELDFAMESGCRPVDLGPYILRAETAAIAAAAIALNA